MRARPATAADITAVIDFPSDPALGVIDGDQLRREFAEHQMRPEWTWLVEDGGDGAVVGRAMWWGRGDSVTPLSLDCLDVLDSVGDREQVAADVFQQAQASFAAAGATHPPECMIRLAANWRDDADAVRATNWRIEAARRAGLDQQTERLRYEWAPTAGRPKASNRVAFRPGAKAEFLSLFSQVADGTLDIGTRRALAVMDPQRQAQDDYNFYLGCPGERDWWRVGTDLDGTPVGFIIPSATPYNRNVGYLGVLPQHRGRGLVDDLLNEVTRIHAAAGAERITATTDTTNAPMATAFDRAGYRVTEVRLMLSAPPRPGPVLGR